MLSLKKPLYFVIFYLIKIYLYSCFSPTFSFHVLFWFDFQEFDAEKQKYSREKDLLLNKAEEHRVKAKKFAEELSNLKQNHMQTKQEVGEVCAEMRRSRFCIQDHVFRFIHSYIYSFIYLTLAKFA